MPLLVKGNYMSQFTVQVKGGGLIDSTIEKSIIQAATYVGNLLDRYIIWKGVLDIEIQVKPASALTWSTANGLLPALGQISWTGSSWTNSTLQECLTGEDANTQLPDAGCTIYLGSDGTIRNYGIPVWFDPNPQFDVTPDLPKGYFDFIGVLTHEIFHCLGFYGVTDQWKKFVVKDGNQSYFDGSITKSLLGSALPLAPDGSSDHYGNLALASNNAPRGLMWQYGNYELNRLDIGRIDLAVLQDLGYQIRTYEGLPLFELSDSFPNIIGTNASETLYGNYQDNVISGSGSNDIIDGGKGNDTIDGGSGTDYVIYADNFADCSITPNGLNYTVKTKTEGTDSVANIEFLKFLDQTIDIITGTALKDTFTSTYRNEYINGGEGIDTVIYSSNRSNYTLTRIASTCTVTDKTGVDGADTLTNIERLQFSDRNVALDIDGNAGQAYRVYQAAFNRTPDNGGLKYWIGLMDSGYTLAGVTSGFIASAEFKTLYGSNPTNELFVSKLYDNVLHRTPDIGGYNYWVGLLNTNKIDNISTLINFSESPENQAGVIGVIQNGIDLLT